MPVSPSGRFSEELEPERAVLGGSGGDGGGHGDHVAALARAQDAGLEVHDAAWGAEQPRVVVPVFLCGGDFRHDAGAGLDGGGEAHFLHHGASVIAGGWRHLLAQIECPVERQLALIGLPEMFSPHQPTSAAVVEAQIVAELVTKARITSCSVTNGGIVAFLRA